VFARIVGQHDASIALHRKHGFRVVGTEREVGRKFGQWLDVVLMEHLVDGNRRPQVHDPTGHPVLAFVEAFGDHAPDERRDLLERCLAPEFRYCDPEVPEPVRGIGEMDQLITSAREADPSLRVRAEGDPVAHHDVFRLAWARTGRHGTSRGTFSGEVDHTGRILRIDVFGPA
jgi:hypothetical protein